MAGQDDWDKQMAEIDRLMAKEAKAGPPAPASAPGQAPADARQPAAAPARAATGGAVAPVPRGGMLGLWSLALLGAIGAGALTVWPYAKGCGMMLAVYLVGVAAVGAAGVWTMRASWLARRGLPHVVGIVTILAALTLAALEILPRVGYAATALTWGCTT